MFIITFLSTFLILSRGKIRRSADEYNVGDSNWDPFLFVSKGIDETTNYDITNWVQQLHLQQCAFVEIGEGFCALFVELRSIPSDSEIFNNAGVAEFFLGLCSCSTLRSWNLCSTELTKQRKLDCIFTEATPYSNTSGRVHRRLCDITLLSENAPICNCSIPLAERRLHKTRGFPTCFLNPLPDSLCSPRGVCGIAECTATTIKGIHIPRCAFNCHERQPFCEEIGPWTSVPPAINSIWSPWSSARCNSTCGNGVMVASSICYNRITKNPAVDCIGPGSFCCPDGIDKCYCEVNVADGIMRAARFTEPCISVEGCIPSNARTFTFEGELDPGNSIDFDEVYEDDGRERFEGAIHSAQRRLLQVYRRDDEYPPSGNSLTNNNRRNNLGYRSLLRSRIDYAEEEEEDDDDEDDNEKNADDDNVAYEGNTNEAEVEEAEDEQQDDEETIGLRGSAKGRWSPRKRTRVVRSGYATDASEGKPQVDEPEANGPTEISSVTEECDDESTEVLQYYDYEPGDNATSSENTRNARVTFDLKLLVFHMFLAFLG